MDIQIIGVYPVDTEEPCHLIEMKINVSDSRLDIGRFTQEIPGEPNDNWQVPWDEHFLNHEGTETLNPDYPDEKPDDDELRVAFFFHYLDFDKPLKTPSGDLSLPQATDKPDRLNFLEYEPPY